MQQTVSYKRRSVRWLASEKFFWIIVAALIFQAGWLALTGRYPMAFDEDFHFGIIQLYAHHISPFWSAQPPGADAFGAVTRDPSYLYQYLMSFPYRLIHVFTHDLTIQVLWLRAISIALFASSLGLFRRLLAKTGASRAMIHGCLAVFVLIPVVPLLAAQINYDNLLIPLVALTLLLTIQLSERFGKGKPLDVRLILTLLILCLLSSLVKYAYLPIFLAIVCFLLVRCWQIYKKPHILWRSVRLGLQRIRRRTLLLLSCGVVLSAGLFLQRYGVNLVRYHEIIPDCSQVLTVQQCKAYGPWNRDYSDSLNKIDDNSSTSVVDYIGDWFFGMWLRTFFAVDGPRTGYETRGPLIVPSMAAIVFVVAGVGAIAMTARRLLRSRYAPTLWLFAAASFVYLLALWLDEYKSYVYTAQPVAINGRYLFPVLPLILVLMALAFNQLLQQRYKAKVVLASVAIVSLLWGGGALTYILRSNSAWYWPGRPVYDVNHTVQRILGPLTPGYDRPEEFL